MKRSNLYLLKTLLIFVIFFIISAKPVFSANEPSKEWNVWETKELVPLSKTWEVNFSNPIDRESVNSESVYIENTRNGVVKTSLSMDDSGRAVIIDPPADGYEADEVYTLYITSKVTSSSNQLLTKPVKMEFRTVSVTPPFIPREDSKNKIEMSASFKEVNVEDIQSITENLVRFSPQKGDELEENDLFFTPPTEEFPFGQARKVVSKVIDNNEVIVNTMQPELEEIIANIDISQVIEMSGDNFIPSSEISGNSTTQRYTKANKKIEFINLKKDGVKVVFSGFEIETLNTSLEGYLEIRKPMAYVDIEPLNSGRYKFNRLEFVAKEKFELKISSNISSKKQERIELGSFPMPMSGFKGAGVNAIIYLIVSGEGKIGFEYVFEQSASIGVGLMNDQDKMIPIHNFQFNTNSSGVQANGEAKISTGIETGLYLKVGDLSLAQLTTTISANNNIKGKPVDMSNDGIVNPTACYLITPDVRADGEFSLGIKFENKWFGSIGVWKKFDLFSKSLYTTKLGNCIMKDLQILIPSKQVKPGELQKLKVRGTVQNGTREIKDLYIPSDYISFQSYNKDIVTVNEDGTISVHPTAKVGSRVLLAVYYRDPLTEQSISDSVYVEIIADEEKEEENDEKPEEPPVENGEGDDEETEPSLTIVKVPDPLLEKEIRKNIEKPIGSITAEDMLKITSLYIYPEKKELDLSGIEYAKNLNWLSLSFDRIDNLDKLSSLSNIEYLGLGESNIRDISALKKLTNLETLILNDNQITDISALNNLSKLKQLNLSNNKINNIGVLEKLTNLSILNMGRNEIQDISVLKNLTQLTYLILEGNQIDNIDALSTLVEISELVITENKITEINALQNLSNLILLDLSQNKVQNISALKNLTNLRTLLLTQNEIQDIQDLSNLSNLEFLSVANNKIKDIHTIGKLSNLEYLYVDNNEISDVSSIGKLTNLIFLYGYSNKIEDISKWNNLTKLTNLKIDDNYIKDIKVLKDLPMLDHLTIKNNPLNDYSIIHELQERGLFILY